MFSKNNIAMGQNPASPTVDGRNPAPPRKPWNHVFSVNSNEPWFQTGAGFRPSTVPLVLNHSHMFELGRPTVSPKIVWVTLGCPPMSSLNQPWTNHGGSCLQASGQTEKGATEKHVHRVLGALISSKLSSLYVSPKARKVPIN